MQTIRAGLTGACVAIAMTFPLAALTALVYRFPIPFGSYASGPDAVLLSLGAVAFYGVALGGFAVLGVLGLAAGLIADRVARGSGRRVMRLTMLLATAIAATGVVALAVLDKIIGPW